MLLRILAGVALLATAFAAPADEILLNGDFSDGKTHWHGDGESSDAGGRIVIRLQPDKWSIIHQRISAETTRLRLSITYSLSDDCSLAQPKSADEVRPLTSDDLQAAGVDPIRREISMLGSGFGMVLDLSGGEILGEAPIFGRRDAPKSADPSTFSGLLDRWWGQFDGDEFCLAFPPGTGTVTLYKVELVTPDK